MEVVYCSERRMSSGARYHRVTTCLVMVRCGCGALGSSVVVALVCAAPGLSGESVRELSEDDVGVDA